MSLRWRLALALALVAAVATTGVALAADVSAGRELTRQTDRSLRDRAERIVAAVRVQPALQPQPQPQQPGGRPGAGPNRAPVRPPVGQIDTNAQRLGADGRVVEPAASTLPVGDVDREIAAGRHAPRTHTVHLDGEPTRILTSPIPNGGAVQVAQSVSGLQSVRNGLRGRLALLAGLAVAASALVGYLVAGRVARPVAKLTEAAEEVARTEQLSVSLPEEGGKDEVARLGTAFRSMLTSLTASREQQRRLVQDASHELRTPLTSLRTNAEVLRDIERLSPEDRERLLDDVTAETQELADLVDELVVLAREPGARSNEPLEPLRLDEVVEDVVERSRRRTGREITVNAAPTIVSGRRADLERAVANLVGNADKFSPAGEPIEVFVAEGHVRVHDRGPGIPPEDRPHAAKRFWRSDAARSAPGSGLGLAIVEQVVHSHGGTLEIGDAPEGGAAVGFRLPQTL